MKLSGLTFMRGNGYTTPGNQMNTIQISMIDGMLMTRGARANGRSGVSYTDLPKAAAFYAAASVFHCWKTDVMGRGGLNSR